jgi:hypothetical protein
VSDEPPKAAGPGAGDASPAREAVWKKLSVRVAAITAALVALAGVFTAVSQVVKSGQGMVTSILEIVWKPAPAPPPYTVEMKPLKVLPHSLLNLLGAHAGLNWFALDARNRSREPLHLVVEVEVLGGPARQEQSKAGQFTIQPGGDLSRPVNPFIQFLRSDFTGDERVRLAWKVTTASQAILHTGTQDVQVLPRETVAWDLQGPRGQPVPRDLLLASLTAWVFTPDAGIDARARDLLAKVAAVPEPGARFRGWLKLCYESLFSASGSVRVSGDRRGLLAAGHQVVRSPSAVLRRGQATPLEAALLLASHRRALAGAIRGRLALFALPAERGGGEAKTFLLAWSAHGPGWQAIETNEASALDFDANAAQASGRLEALLASRAEIGPALETQGVFVAADGPVVALDFWRAHQHYRIRPLP